MTQKTTTTPTQTPSVKEILATIASIEWEESDNHGEAPVPSPNGLDNPAYWNLDGIRAYVDLTPRFFQAFMTPDIITRIKKIHQIWETVRETNPKLKHPLAPVIRAWQQEQGVKGAEQRAKNSIKTASVDHVQDMVAMPYTASEVNRRKWEEIGSIDAVEVDGEPIVTAMANIPPYSREHPDDLRTLYTVFKPSGAQGELQLQMPPGRDTMETPLPLVAYKQYGSDLRSATAADVAQVMSLAYAANEPLTFSLKDDIGASILSRGGDGKPRPPKPTDVARFEKAFMCLYGMAGWVKHPERNSYHFMPFLNIIRDDFDCFTVSVPEWLKRDKGKFTLTAGFGVAGQNRLVGQAHTNNIWRVVAGVEYYLARGKAMRGGHFKRVSQELTPANGNTGPGVWQELTWQELMMTAGDVWNLNDKTATAKAYKRFEKVRAMLKQAGYGTPSLGRKGAPAGDTVEFFFRAGNPRRGRTKVYTRAADRFIEAARKAKNQEWEQVSLTEFLGWKG